MNLTALTRFPAKAPSFVLFAKRPSAPQNLASVLREIYCRKASPQMATDALLSAMKRFPLESGHVPPGDVGALNITLRQTGAPGLWEFHQEYQEARLYLAKQSTGPLKSAIAKVLGDAFLDCHNAQMRWGSRMMRAHSEDDRETLALATMMLGEEHPTVAHVRAVQSGTLISRLYTAQRTCEAVPSEALDIWEQTEPLNVGMEAEAPQLPTAYAPRMQVEHSPSPCNNPQDPSIERLLRERESRSRPLQAFLMGMMGSPAA